MKNMDLFVASILLFSQVLPTVAMNSSELSCQSHNNQSVDKLLNTENQSCIRAHSLHNYALDEENSMMSSLSCTHEDTSNSHDSHDQASINAMVVGLMSRAHKQDEIIAQQERQISYLTEQVKKDAFTRNLVINIYKSFPQVVCEIKKIQNQLLQCRKIKDKHIDKLNALQNVVDEYSGQHADIIRKLIAVVEEHENRHEKHEAFFKELHISLKKNQASAKKDIKKNTENT